MLSRGFLTAVSATAKTFVGAVDVFIFPREARQKGIKRKMEMSPEGKQQVILIILRILWASDDGNFRSGRAICEESVERAITLRGVTRKSVFATSTKTFRPESFEGFSRKIFCSKA